MFRWWTKAPLTVVGAHTRQRLASITFDDGPDPDTTPQILDILQQAGIPATFFVLGKQLEACPSVARRMIEEGHAIGNHSFGHERFIDLDPAELKENLERCDTAIHAATGTRSSLVRPPFGMQHSASARVCHQLKLKTVHWNLASEDWQGHDGPTITKQLLDHLQPGSIILMHDRLEPPTGELPGTWAQIADRQASCEALLAFIPEAQAQGYTFLTVPELLRAAKSERCGWHLARS